MRLVIAGGTGFIGAALCHALARQGHALTVLSRRPPATSLNGARVASWDAAEWRQAVADADGVVNLAGAPIAAARWTPQQKQRLRDSRITTTRRLVEAMAEAPRASRVLINASAIGYYGPRGDEPLDEQAPAGSGFLAEVCQAWEAEAQRAETTGARVVRLRIGLVLGAGGGALSKMVPPFRLGLGGPLGSGRQWMSWIHRDDVNRMIEWALTHPDLRGPVNAVSPDPVTMREFCAALGRVLRRPSWLPAPAPVLRLLLGEMADMLLTGQRVIPQAAQRQGFTFRYPDVTQALAACAG